MSEYFNLVKFLGTVHPAPLRQFFKLKGVNIKFARTPTRLKEPLLVVDQLLKSGEVGKAAVAAMVDIGALATTAGTLLIADLYRRKSGGVEIDWSGVKSASGRAMLAYLLSHEPSESGDNKFADLFDDCRMWSGFDDMSWRVNRRRSGLPKKVPNVSQDALNELGTVMSSRFILEGRGYKCIPRHRYIPDRLEHQVLVLSDDYPETELEFGPHLNPTLIPRERRPIVEIGIRYSQLEGSLEVSIDGKKSRAIPVLDAFCKINLGLEDGAIGSKPTVKIQGLFDGSQVLPKDPGGQWKSVALTAMKVRRRQDRDQRIEFMVGAKDAGASVLSLVDSVIPRETPVRATYEVQAVTIKFIRPMPGNSKRSESCQARLTIPDECNLRDSPIQCAARSSLIDWKLLL